MYHRSFTGSHYEAGFKWGKKLNSFGIKLDFCPTFELTEDKYIFSEQCSEVYNKYFPEILEEIKGIADGNGICEKTLRTILFSMYCFELNNHCTCFAISTDNEIIFGRNSDFLVSLEKYNMNCIYSLSGSYSFNANTTAYVEMEDGVNEKGLAAGLTFVFPKVRNPGINAGMLIRYILEKCKTTEDAVKEIRRLPISSAQTITLADKSGDIAVVECNPENVIVLRPEPNTHFVSTTNNFYSLEMKPYRNPGIDDWRSDDRFKTVYNSLSTKNEVYTVDYAKSILSGKYGFICQYDRRTNADTVWSVVYDLKRNHIWRAEGNPSRKQYKRDTRLKFSDN